MMLSINYPAWIHPEIFPGVPVLGILRWYGLMYVLAFATAYFVMRKVLKEGGLNSPNKTTTEDDMFSYFATVIVGLLIGARVFSTLIYDTSGMYLKKPWLIFWPFNAAGSFTGLAGMSYHGGFIGGLSAMIIWCLVKKRPVHQWIDAIVLAIPLGYTFGRLGNFLNGELYGRITTMPWGIVFPSAERFSVSIPWVAQIAEEAGIQITESTKLVNLPRHPSQLYEAFFEGIVLWTIMWLLRKKKPFNGFFASFYTIGYGFVRFFIEYFREPDADIGYRITVNSDASIYFNSSMFNLSTGQILCLLMVVGGIGWMICCALLDKKQKASKSTKFTSNTKAETPTKADK